MSIRHIAATITGIALGTWAAGAWAQDNRIWTIATNPPGSIAYSAGSALAKLLVEKYGLHFRILPGAGSSTFVPQIDRGEADFGISNPVEASDGFHGRGLFEGKASPNYRLAGGIQVFYFGMIVPADNPARTLGDLKGKTIPTEFKGQLAMVPVMAGVLANAGVSVADFKPFPVVNQVKGTEALGEGRVDTASHNPSAAAVRELQAKLAGRGGVKFLDLDDSPAAIARMKAVFPYGSIVTLEPSPAYVGIARPTKILAYPIMLTTGAHVPDKVVETVIKALHDDHAILATFYPGFKDFDPKKLLSVAADMPYHPAAERMFKALGL